MAVFPPFYRRGNGGSWNNWLQVLLVRQGALLWPPLSLSPLCPCDSHTGANGQGPLTVSCLSDLNKSPTVNSSLLVEFLGLMAAPGSGFGSTRKFHASSFKKKKNYIEKVIKWLLSAGKSARHWSGYQPFCSTRLFTSSNRVSASCHLHHIS